MSANSVWTRVLILCWSSNKMLGMDARPTVQHLSLRWLGAINFKASIYLNQA